MRDNELKVIVKNAGVSVIDAPNSLSNFFRETFQEEDDSMAVAVQEDQYDSNGKSQKGSDPPAVEMSACQK